MPAVWSNSPLISVIRKVRKMVALSAAFQSRAGITYQQAFDRVAYEYVPTADEEAAESGIGPTVERVMPWASLWPMNTGATGVSGGSQVWTLPNGMIHLYIACNPLPNLSWNDRREEALGFLDQWITDVMNLSGADDPTNDDGMGFATVTRAGSVLIDHSPYKNRETTGDIYYQSIGLNYGDGEG